MADRKKKGKYIGWAGAVLVHVLLVCFLFLMSFQRPLPEEESGMPVMLGEVPDAGGFSDPSLVDVEVMPEAAPVPEVEEATESELLTQDYEETVALEPEKTEAEKAEEARLKAEAEAERKRKEAEEAARRRVAGAVGKGAQLQSHGTTSGGGLHGSAAGTASHAPGV